MKSKMLPSSTQKRSYLKKFQIDSTRESKIMPDDSEDRISDNRIIDRLRSISVKSKKKLEEKREEEEKRRKEKENLELSSEGKENSNSEEEKETVSESSHFHSDNKEDIDLKARNNLLLFKKKNANKVPSFIQNEKNIYDIERFLPLLSYGKMATLEMNTYGMRKSNVFNPGEGAAILNMLPNLMSNEGKVETSVCAYLNNLTQNKNLEPGTITEIDSKGVQIKTNKYFTFFRIEHEVSDLIRKSNDFEESRKSYIERKNENLKESYAELIRQNDPFKTSDKIKNLKEYKKGLEIARKYVQVQKKKAGKDTLTMAEQFINDSKKLTLAKASAFF